MSTIWNRVEEHREGTLDIKELPAIAPALNILLFITNFIENYLELGCFSRLQQKNEGLLGLLITGNKMNKL